MAKGIVLKSEKNITYLTEHLESKLKSMDKYAVTMIDAPVGFGKTSAIKEFSQNSTKKFIWINVFSDSKEIFWSDFCDAFGEISSEAQKELFTLEYPHSEKNVAQIRRILKNLKPSEDTFIVIDNYHLIVSYYFELLIQSVIDVLPDEIHFVFLTQELPSAIAYDLVRQNAVLHITKADLELSSKDIQVFFEKHNLMISSDEADKLYDYTGGWVSAIFLQMFNYAETGKMDNKSSMNDLVEKTVWSKLKASQKLLLIGLSTLDFFTLKEAVMMAPDKVDSDRIEMLLNNMIFIRFDKSNRNFYVHHIFADYLNNEYKLLSKEERDEITTRTGNVFMSRNQIFPAYQKYYQAGKWEEIYKSVPSFVALYPYINRENKEFFISLINNCPYEIREKYYYFPIIMCFVLFMYNEKSRLVEYIMDIVFSVEENEELTERQKKNILGTIYFVRGYTEFNNISMMHEFYKKSLDYAGAPVIDLTAGIPFTFGCPSMLHIFFRENESLSKILDELNSCMPDYYKLSQGHGKGAEALMKAEILFNHGDLEGAETLCHKAVYMADSREQISIAHSSMLLLSRISIFEGDYDIFLEHVENAGKKFTLHADAMDIEYINQIDLVKSYMYSLIDDVGNMSEWLTDYQTIENRMNIISMSYANIVYSKYLFLNEDYQKFLGISGQFLGIASIFNLAMPKIYTYIFIAMCHLKLENKSKAIKMLGEALKLAAPEMIMMPFVENHHYFEEIFEEINFSSDNRDFIKKTRSLASKYESGLKSIKKSVLHNDNFGLTARELEVAKLAAARLSNKEIAEKLFIAESTVKSNLKIIFNKMNIASRTELSKFFK